MTRAKADPVRDEIRRIFTDAGVAPQHVEWMTTSCPSVAAAQAYVEGRRRREALKR
ncbi:MAG: hypothetical protein AB7O24_04345 [Kofleriaceae bacterium]